MNTSFQYRLANDQDFEQLKALSILAYHEFFPELTEDNQVVLKAALHNETNLNMLLSKSICFVCEVAGYIAGMAYLMPKGNPTNIYPAEWSYIRMVGVAPAYRGHGIAKQLTQNCIDYARKSGEQIVGLHTSEMMDAARHIYEALGFDIVKELDPIFGKRYWLYRLDI